MLLNNNSDIAIFEDGNISTAIDRQGVCLEWRLQGFPAMVKYIEDRLNVENDMRIGMVG
jgi:hypothetical protein